MFRVGDGSAALSNASAAAFLDNFSLAGASLGTVPLSAGATPFTVSGSATSEGQITGNGSQIAIAGYGVGPGTTGVASTTSATVPRVVQVYNGVTAGQVASTGTSFSGNNVRSAYTAGSTTYAVGGNTGVVAFAGGGETTVSTTSTNIRVVNSFGGNLFYSTGSTAGGTQIGLYRVGTGLPTSGPVASTLLFTTAGTGTGTASPYAFALNDAGTVAYVADDRTAANGGGVQKWTSSGGTWSLAGTFNNLGTQGTRGLAVDFSGASPVLYATTAAASANSLVSLTDTGSNFADPFTVLVAAPTNTAFRGLAFTPVPEPGTVLAVAAAGLGGLRLARRRLRRA